MDLTGPESWERLLQQGGHLEDVGVVNQQAGIREEKWSNLDLKHLKFPAPLTQAVRRATLVQHVTPAYMYNLVVAMQYLQMALRAREGLGLQDCSACPEGVIFEYVWGGAKDSHRSYPNMSPLQAKWGVISENNASWHVDKWSVAQLVI